MHLKFTLYILSGNIIMSMDNNNEIFTLQFSVLKFVYKMLYTIFPILQSYNHKTFKLTFLYIYIYKRIIF